ncbi:MAG TPA: MspA protein, partial [Chloroflexota bacterium]|nr:MspA protein [Chloroflexota bacterium]
MSYRLLGGAAAALLALGVACSSPAPAPSATPTPPTATVPPPPTFIAQGQAGTSPARTATPSPALTAYNRGVERAGRGEYQAAIADFTEALGA